MPLIFAFLSFIPLISVWIDFRCLVFPPGYAIHRRLDTTAKVAVAGIGAAFAIVVLAVVYSSVLALLRPNG